MKKLTFLLSMLIISACFGYASEIEDDYLDIAGNYCITGEYSSAMEYLDRILQINPSNTQASALKKGLTHIMSGTSESFVSGVNPKIKEASQYQKTGDENNRYHTLLSATGDNNSYLAYYFLGNYYRENKNYQKALDAYNSSVSARSDFAPAYLALGIVLSDMGKYESALNPIDKYLTFAPEDDLAYAIKSRAEFALGMFSRSASDNEHALLINNCPEYQFDRAKLLYINGNYEESKKLFSSLINDIQTEKIYEYMGLCDYALKNYNEALLNFDKAIILSDDDEYLKSKYDEIKNILESKNDQIEE